MEWGFCVHGGHEDIFQEEECHLQREAICSTSKIVAIDRKGYVALDNSPKCRNDMKLSFKFALRMLVCSAPLLANMWCNSDVDISEPAFTRIDTLTSSTHFLWPSQKGSSWTYTRYFLPGFWNRDSNWVYEGFGSFGIDMDTSRFDSLTYVVEITKSMLITIGDTVYPSVVLGTRLKIPYYVGSDGVYNMGIFEEGGDSLLKKGLYLPKDIPLDRPWTGQISFKQEGKLQIREVIERRCYSYDEVIQTPAGVFHCYAIRTRDREAEDYPGYVDYYQCFAPGVGLVAAVQIFILPNAYWFLDYMDLLQTYTIGQ
jgi:hypothetical protein